MASAAIDFSNLGDAKSKIVQELTKKGGEIPDKYIQKDGVSDAIDAPDELWNETLLIDMSLLNSPSPDIAADELAKLRNALSTWGGFYIKNHGMESSFLEEVLEVSKGFFALPLDEKLKSSIKDNVLQGYTTDASSFFREGSVNWNDRLLLSIFPEEGRNLSIWPENPPNFRDVISEYSRKLVIAIDTIYKAMARSLDLEEDEFKKQQGETGAILASFTYYPPCPCPDHVIGLEPHSDGTIITFLLPQKGVEGLQVIKDDQWYKVPVIPDALFVNAGDFAEVISNGIFKSCMHRVVTNTERDRTSVIAFCAPGPQDEVGPSTALVTADRPACFKKFTPYELKRMFFRNFGKGLSALDPFRI